MDAAQYQGGFVLDGGVHFAAALRTVLPAPPTHLAGFARLTAEHLAPTDTVHAVVQTADGVTGTFALSLAPPDGAYGASNGFFVAGADGALSVCPVGAGGAWRFAVRPKGGEEEAEEIPQSGVEAEVRAFVDVVGGGKDDGRQRPQGALADLAFIEATLVSNGQLVDLQALVGDCN
jgi:predicted dehydrogenase